MHRTNSMPPDYIQRHIDTLLAAILSILDICNTTSYLVYSQLSKNKSSDWLIISCDQTSLSPVDGSIILCNGIPGDTLGMLLSICDGLYFPFIRRDLLMYQQMQIIIIRIIISKIITEVVMATVFFVVEADISDLISQN